MSSASSLARVERELSPVKCDPAGGGLAGAVARPEAALLEYPRRHVTRALRSYVATFPRVVPALIRPAGTPLRPSGVNRRTSTAAKPAAARWRRVGPSRR